MGTEVSIKPAFKDSPLGREELSRKNKILVVDDVAVNVQLLMTYLSSVGYEVFTARDGQEALDKVAETQPDLILLDVMMPKLNGFEVCERLKTDPMTKIIPVIMVTALNEIEDKIKATESGADDFVSKPFNKLELLTRVKSLLRIKQLHDELRAKVRELEQARERLRQLAITDGLTGLYNHRYLKEHLEQELLRANRHQSRVSVVMLDIDHFKKFNDMHGHQTGDQVLRLVAMTLRSNVKGRDLAARYGGEEFALVLPATSTEGAVHLAENIRKAIQSKELLKRSTNERLGRVTASFGVATWTAGDTAQSLIERADKCLYSAKAAGRNRVVHQGEKALLNNAA